MLKIRHRVYQLYLSRYTSVVVADRRLFNFYLNKYNILSRCSTHKNYAIVLFSIFLIIKLFYVYMFTILYHNRGRQNNIVQSIAAYWHTILITICSNLIIILDRNDKCLTFKYHVNVQYVALRIGCRLSFIKESKESVSIF